MDSGKQTEKMESLIASARELDAEFRKDPHRPTYHFTASTGWMNDINGAIFWSERAHIFRQHQQVVLPVLQRLDDHDRGGAVQ